jgi:Ca-activated chloride channel family protein
MPIEIDFEKDYYAVLGVSRYAVDEEIKRAYRGLARLYHPDSANGDAARFRVVQEAYEVLRDAVRRRAYDRQREARGLSEDSALSLEVILSRKQLPMIDVSQVLYALVDISPQGDSAGVHRNLNLVLVIDRSTSMRGARMNNVKLAAQDMVEAMRPEDRLGIVSFSDRAEVVAPSTLGSDKQKLYTAIASLSPSGGTEIYQGLYTGLEEVCKNLSDRYINHVILLTDGRTYGDEDLCLTEARHASEQGIGLSALGIGEDWNDVFLDKLVSHGNGVSQYISSPSQVRDVLREQIRGLSSVLVRNLHLKINPVSYVQVQNVYRTSPYLEHLSKGKTEAAFMLGNLSLEDSVIIVIEFVVHPSEGGQHRIARLDLDAEEMELEQPIRLRRDIEVVMSKQVMEEPPPTRLVNLMARLSVFKLQERAWEALEAGNAQQATHLLETAATHLFSLGHKELAQSARMEATRLAHEGSPSKEGRKRLRYGTRSLTTA